MKNKSLIVLVFIVLGVIAVFREQFFDFSKKLSESKVDIENTIIDEVKKEIFAPPPLRAKQEAAGANLTQGGVLSWTNENRKQNGLPALSANPALNLAAALKVNDMFGKQYFAHVSPSGLGPDHWVDEAGYKYVTIGENLALGNFKDDEELVRAWMDSPGHRANILNSRFTEIGVAVGEGVFEGKTTWLAVQVFGLPLSSCTEPSQTLKSRIDLLESQIDSLEDKLAELKAKIESRNKRDPEYNQLVKEYNDLVAQYNGLIDEFKSLIGQYNGQVIEFNKCLAG